jgi:hypothetical protein
MRPVFSFGLILVVAISSIGCGKSEPSARPAADPRFDAATNPQHAAATSGQPATSTPAAGGHGASK